jgi:hypothetical protein
VAKTLLLGRTAYRVITRRKNAHTIHPLDAEYPHLLLMRDPSNRARWGLVKRGSNDVTFYRAIGGDGATADAFEPFTRRSR